MKEINNFINTIKEILFSLELSFLIFAVSASILFAPEKIITKISLLEFKNEYKSYFGLIFLIALVWFVINIIKFLVRQIKKISLKFKNAEYEEKIISKINNLYTEHKLFFQLCILTGRKEFKVNEMLNIINQINVLVSPQNHIDAQKLGNLSTYIDNMVEDLLDRDLLNYHHNTSLGYNKFVYYPDFIWKSINKMYSTGELKILPLEKYLRAESTEEVYQ